jgi:hypothetical protein
METEEHYFMSFERLRKLAADAGTPFGEDSSTIEPSMGANVSRRSRGEAVRLCQRRWVS